jgi:hypothetical protein
MHFLGDHEPMRKIRKVKHPRKDLPSRTLQRPVYRLGKIISSGSSMIFWRMGLAPFG